MADYCCKNKMQELDDVHRLLPPEILKDIGITNADDRRLTAIVDELSSRLAAALGAAVNNGSSQHRRLSPAWATTNSYHHHRTPQPQPQHWHSYRLVDNGNATALKTEAWPRAMSHGGILLDMAICLPRFAPAPRSPQVVHGVLPPPVNHGNRGTGVFLPPRAQAYHHTAKPPRTTGRSADAKPRWGKQQCQQQQRRQFHFHGDRAVLLAATQEQDGNRSGASAASHGRRDELGLPQNGSIDRSWMLNR